MSLDCQILSEAAQKVKSLPLNISHPLSHVPTIRSLSFDIWNIRTTFQKHIATIPLVSVFTHPIISSIVCTSGYPIRVANHSGVTGLFNTGSHGCPSQNFGLCCPLALLGPIIHLLIYCQLWFPVETTRWRSRSSEELQFSK